MPRIPLLRQRASSPAGEPFPRASATAAGVSADAVSRFGEGLIDLGVALEAKRKDAKDVSFVADLDVGLNREFSERLAAAFQDSGKDQTGFAEAILEAYDARLAEGLERAPSEEARQAGARAGEAFRRRLADRARMLEHDRVVTDLLQRLEHNLADLVDLAGREPDRADEFLGKGFGALNGAAAARLVSAEAATGRRDRFKEALYRATVQELIADDPKEALRRLEGGEFDGLLADHEAVQGLKALARGEAARMARADAAAAERIARMSLVRLEEEGSEVAGAAARIAALAGEEAARSFEGEARRARFRHGVVEELRFLAPDDQARRLETLRPEAAGGTADDVALIRDRLARERRQFEADPAGYVAPLVEKELASLAARGLIGDAREEAVARRDIARRLQTGAGIAAPRFLPDERAGALVAAYKAADAVGKAALIAALAEEFDGDDEGPGGFERVVGELAAAGLPPGHDVVARLRVMGARGAALADDLLRGQAILAERPDLVPAKEQFAVAADGLADGIGSSRDRRSLLAAARLLYAERALAAADFRGELNRDRLDSVMGDLLAAVPRAAGASNALNGGAGGDEIDTILRQLNKLKARQSDLTEEQFAGLRDNLIRGLFRLGERLFQRTKPEAKEAGKNQRSRAGATPQRSQIIENLIETIASAVSQKFASANRNKVELELSDLGEDVEPEVAIEAFVRAARENRIVPSDQHVAQLVLPQVSNAAAARVKAKTSLDIATLRHVLDTGQIRHAFARHGPGNEINPEQVPITPEAVAIYLDVIENFDNVTARRNKSGRSTIRYEKQVNGRVVIVEQIRTRENTLAFFSMWIKEAGN